MIKETSVGRSYADTNFVDMLFGNETVRLRLGIYSSPYIDRPSLHTYIHTYI